jgi:carboxypeptidase family protein
VETSAVRGLALFTLLLVFASVASGGAQSPTGVIAGVVTDASTAGVPGIRVAITNRDTAQVRDATTSSDGRYAVEALPPGAYVIAAEIAGFKRVERLATVAAGTTTAVDLLLEVGDVSASLDVVAVAPLIQRDHHQVSGVVTRAQIENLPLNGRNFLELAKLEPGVTNPIRLADNRTFVGPLGAGLQTIPRVGYTRMTVDGASITTPGTIGTILQVSQDTVQEFQISTVNFDPTTSLTSNGAINIVTRSGGNQAHASGFSFYRDHRMAAYPGLSRDASNPDPFFQRHQFGVEMGGPVRRDRSFFFASYERHDQRGVVSVQPRTSAFVPLGGIFPSPYLGNQINARADVRLHPNHNGFIRYTRDGNSAFAGAANVLPSGWVRRTNEAHQSLAALTSVLTAHVVNDVRVSYFFARQLQGAATSADCRGCLGLGAPRITIPDANLSLGTANKLSAIGRRYQLTDSVVWQRGKHRVRFGFDWEHTLNSVETIEAEPAQITLWAPGRVRQTDPAIPLPPSFTTVEDILRLPLHSFETAVGPGTIPWRDFQRARVLDLYRSYVSDTWHAGARLTINGGLTWSYEPNALNHDLTKPMLLAPLLGSDGLRPPRVEAARFSPTVGFAWTLGRDGKTVVRSGAGHYFDPVGGTTALNLANERVALSPLGTARLIMSGANLRCNAHTLEFLQPTAFTGAHLLSCLDAIRAELLRSVNPDNRDFSLRNIDRTKQGTNLYDPHYQTPYAVHFSLGVQRELAAHFVVSADVVWKRFSHTFINGIDYNRWNSTTGPVIPPCTDAQRNDVHALCSMGNIFFDTTIGRARYTGLLVRGEKRFSDRAQLLASYALGSYVGTNGTGTGTNEGSGGRVFGFNNDDWFENYGPLPTDRRHVLNLSGFVDLPMRFRVAVSVSAYSRPPFSAYVGGADFNGDGTRNDLLPGTRINQFGRGLDEADLVRLVEQYNQQFANRPTLGGQSASPLTLPDSYSFDDGFFTADMRVSRTFPFWRRARVVLLAESFNLFNIANLVQYSGNLANPATFGQPTARSDQVFGSGGPRAVQLGARLTF